MVDSVATLPPGWRATGNNNALVTDGILAFFDAGTTNPLEVFSDAALSVSLGTTVSCNAAGYPVSSGNNKVLIYTGADPYKIRLTSVLFGGTVFEFDNVRGALDTSSFLTSASVADEPVVNTSSNRAITISDKGKVINLNCSGGALTATFDAATTLGDGFWVRIRHDGAANQVRITGNGLDTFAIPGASTTAFSLLGRGEAVQVNCDGAGFKVSSCAPAFIAASPGVIVIADRLSAPPVSPNPGARYIVGSSPSGAWSSFAQHDIAEANGLGGWFRYTPTADLGWIAYVQDEDVFYSFRGSAWSAGTNKIPTVQRFTSGSGTWTAPDGVNYIRVRMVGGGGGGSAATTNAGSAGSSSSFGSWTAIAGGGTTGITTAGNGGTGGTNGTGTLVIRVDGQNGSTTPSGICSGFGGNTYFGGGGVLLASSTAGTAGKANTGGGGSAGSNGSSAGAGGGGGEYVEFLVNAPTTASYTVGGGGTGGAAGGNAGGNGAAGVIIVEEFY